MSEELKPMREFTVTDDGYFDFSELPLAAQELRKRLDSIQHMAWTNKEKGLMSDDQYWDLLKRRAGAFRDAHNQQHPRYTVRTIDEWEKLYAEFLVALRSSWATGLCSAHQLPDPTCRICNPAIQGGE